MNYMPAKRAPRVRMVVSIVEYSASTARFLWVKCWRRRTRTRTRRRTRKRTRTRTRGDEVPVGEVLEEAVVSLPGPRGEDTL